MNKENKAEPSSDCIERVQKVSPTAARLMRAGFSQPEATAIIAAIDYVYVTDGLGIEYGDTTVCALKKLKAKIDEERKAREA